MFYASNEQKAIRDHLYEKNNRRENAKVDVIAPAGSGKTTTILFLMDSLSDKKVLYLVFNTAMKKEIEQRLNFSTSSFEMINKDNIDIYTFHGYMRNILNQKISDIGFDYANGSITAYHIANVMKSSNFDTDSKGLSVVSESFNKYIKDFVKTTQTLKDFYETKSNSIQIDEPLVNAISPYLKEIKQIDIEYFNELIPDEQEEIVRDVYNDFVDSIFNKNALTEAMPHDIYYKYVYHNYSELDLFQDYQYVMVDEAQDIDPIIIALLDKANVNLIKFGDNFQQINRFRGTVNALEDAKNDRFALTASYRLTPYMGLLTEAFLSKEAEKLGYSPSDVPRIYGSQKTSEPLKQQQIKTIQNSSFFSEIVSELSSVKVEESDTYKEIQENKMRIESSINKGSKTTFNKAVSKFLKEKDYEQFYLAIVSNTSLYNHDETTVKRNTELLKMNVGSQFHKELYQVAKNYNFKLSNKEKRELLVTSSGTFGYLTRNNKKAIDFVYQLSKQIPMESISEMPLFNVKFNLSLSDTFDNFTKQNFGGVTPKDMAILSSGLDNVSSKVVSGISAWNNHERLSSIAIPQKLLAKLLKDKNSAFGLVDVPFINIQGVKHSLADYGVEGKDLRDIIDGAIKTAKTKITKQKLDADEVTAQHLVELSGLSSLGKLIPFDKYVKVQTTLEELKEKKLGLIESYYKYSDIKETAKYNPNINLVKDGAFYNIYCSTIHQVKGLEMDRVLLGNDIYSLDDEKDLEENRDEFKLAYVALTRTKKSLSLEEGSPLTQVIENTLDSGYSRFYESDNAILKEVLSSKMSNRLPKYEIYIKDSMDMSVVKNDTMFFGDGIFPTYKDIVMITEKDSGKFLDIQSKGEDFKSKYGENSEIHFFKPLNIDEDEFNQIVEKWNNELNEQRVELEQEAMGLF